VGSKPIYVRYRNGLLASLTADNFELVRPHLRTVELLQDRVLAEAGDQLTKVYFPHSGVISLVLPLKKGEAIEIAMIGRDSILGAFAALGEPISLSDAVVLIPGIASTLDVEHLHAAADRSPQLRATLVRHQQALFVQAQQTAVCNAVHPVEARLPRWLLRTYDLSGSNRLPLTQELMAQMIGAKRNSVSIEAHTLQRSNLIRYSRGQVEIIDLEALTRASCECYAAVKAQCERLLGSPRIA
jgi:CRP-like cAMP-binding protein